MKDGLGNLAARDAGQLAAIVKNRLKRIQYRPALIGVSDSLVVLGIRPDFRYLKPGKQDADGWLLSLQEVIINRARG